MHINFTSRTGGTIFFTIYYVIGTGKTIFIRLPINFVGGWRFLSSAAELDGTYSIEVEFAYCVMVCAKH